MANAVIWDGKSFRRVSREEAESLVKADKAQMLTGRLTSGNELRRRAQFSGYHNRMMDTGGAVNPPRDPAIPAEDNIPIAPPPPEPEPKPRKRGDWRDRRDVVATYLKKGIDEVTEEEVEKYHGLLTRK